MKMKRLIYLSLLLFAFASCQYEEVHKYLGSDYVQFSSSNTDMTYSFAYCNDTVMRDTVWITANISGDIYMKRRYYKLKQATHYTQETEYAEDGSVLNQVLVETPNQAISGIHYVAFDDPAYQELCYIDSNRVSFKVPVIVMRDISLADTTMLLNIEFVETEDFAPGDYNKRKQGLNISDDVFYPNYWVEGGSNANSKYKSGVFGQYGPVKHRFMIQATGETWDNDFMKALTYEERVAYKVICAKALYQLNLDRESRGEGVLMEDPSYVYGPVTFY